MGILKTVLFVVISLSICFSTIEVKAQNLLLPQGDNGILVEGGMGFSEGFSGPVLGLSYSINGLTGLGVSYGILSTKGEEVYSFSAGVNSFLMAEKTDDAANVEISAIFQRGFSNISENYQSFFAFTGTLSKNLSSKQGVSIIPRVGVTYGISIVTGQDYPSNNRGTNMTAFNLDTIVGIPLARNIKFVLNPGISFRLNGSATSGLISSGILIH